MPGRKSLPFTVVGIKDYPEHRLKRRFVTMFAILSMNTNTVSIRKAGDLLNVNVYGFFAMIVTAFTN